MWTKSSKSVAMKVPAHKRPKYYTTGVTLIGFLALALLGFRETNKVCFTVAFIEKQKKPRSEQT